MLHIFDISAYQGATAPAADAVFVKASEGSTYKSAKFAAQWKSAGTRAKHRGAYHFARPEASSAKSQAARFLDIVRPVAGESVWLDLEASGLNQARTHDWAAAWGDYIREQVPGVTSGIYMGSGYAASNTGRDLDQHFRFWWYPQYPSAYQLASVDVEALRIANRTAAVVTRTPIAAMTKAWPPAVSPWLPGGVTFGRKVPDIWQFTDNWNGLDASVSGLTLAQLAGGGQPTPMEADMISGNISAGKGPKTGVELAEGGPFHKIKIGWDNTRVNPDLGIVRQAPASIRLAMHVPGRKGTSVTVTVGAALDDTKGWADSVITPLPAGCDRIDIERGDDGGALTYCAY
jgi:hypothetical protein